MLFNVWQISYYYMIYKTRVLFYLMTMFYHFDFCRQEGQGTSDELRGRDFRRDLEERERTVREKRDRNRGILLCCLVSVML